MTIVGWWPAALAALATATLLGATLVWLHRARPPRAIPAALLLLGSLPALHELWLRAGAFAAPWLHVSSTYAAVLASGCLALAAHRLQTLRLLSRARRLLVELTTGITLLSCALAAIDLKIARRVTKQALILVLDRSRSMELIADGDGRLRDEARIAELGMREDDLIGVVGFASGAELEDPLRTRTSLGPPAIAELVRDSTNIEAGIRRALAELPEDAAPRLAILSDGAATLGDAEGAAMSAVALGVPIDVVQLEHRDLPNVAISGVRAAAHVSEGEPIELKVALNAAAPCRGLIEIRVDGALVGTAPADLKAGEGLYRLSQPNPGPGFHRYDVTLTGVPPSLDGTSLDNSGSVHVRVRGRGAALVLDSDSDSAAPMQQALAAIGFDAAFGSAVTCPTSLSDFSRYDLVVLGDIPAQKFSPEQLDALAAYVTEIGGGLLLMGGDQSLGPGGYASTPIEKVSPVSFDLKQERRRASLAQVIAIDYSGSMAAAAGSKTKLELANEAAVRSLALLSKEDRLGVAHVDTEVAWTVPLGTVGAQDAIAARIRAVSPSGGGIAVDTALSAAYAALSGEQTQLKHVLLFADGSDATDRAMAPRLAARAYSAGTTTSVVALGTGSDVPALETLSRIGHGRFYLVEDATRLPAVFAQETVLASRRAIVEGSFFTQRLGNAAPLRGVDFATAPALLGYVVTLPKSSAEVLLSAPDSDPLLTVGRSGLGQVGVFASDYRGRWGRAWLAWPGASALFGQLGRSLMRLADDPLVSLRASTTAGGVELEVTATTEEGRSDNSRALDVIVAAPGRSAERHRLEHVASGTYRVEVPTGAPGAYVASLVDAVTGHLLATAATVVDARDELGATHADRRLLRRIAELTGGAARDTLAGIFDERRTVAASFVPLIDSLLVLGAAFLLLSVAARRLVPPDVVSGWYQRLASAATRRNAPSASDGIHSPDPTEELRHQTAASPSLPSPRTTEPGRVEERVPAVGFSSANANQRASGVVGSDAPPSRSHTVDAPPHDARRTDAPALRDTPPRSTLEILLERRRQGRPPRL